MRVKFTLIALVSMESSVYSGSHQSGFQMHSAPHKPGSSVQRGERVDVRVPKQHPTLARCGGTVQTPTGVNGRSSFACREI